MEKGLYYCFVAVLKDTVTVKTRIAKYLLYKQDKMISSKRVNERFQYFVIYHTLVRYF